MIIVSYYTKDCNYYSNKMATDINNVSVLPICKTAIVSTFEGVTHCVNVLKLLDSKF